MRFYKTILVIPIGPNTRVDFVLDTIRSFVFYTSSTYRIILADDSHQGIGRRVQASFPDLDLLLTRRNGGAMAGLYITLSQAFDHAVRHYEFDLLFKLDTDALVIGEKPEEEGSRLFSERPNVAIAGQYPLEYDGKPWDVGWPRARIMNGTMTWKFIKRPVANLLLRKLYLRALRHGYRTGESVFGGAYFMNPSFLKTMREERMLPHLALRSLNMGEDHLFSLIARAYGFELGDLSAGDRPFACAWKGLPASPEELWERGKKVIHSTRSWGNRDEEAIRRFFRDKRERPAQRASHVLTTAE